MRQRLRAVGLLALAVVAITCTDAPTSSIKTTPTPSGVANIRMSPSFSAEAARIYSGLAAFGLTVTEVHIVLTGPDGSKKDTIIAFPANQGQITIEIPVPSSGTDQAFDALIELRNDQHVVLFSGHQTVIARAANLPPLNPPVVIISYTGPGKGTKTVTVSPPDTTIAGTATVAIRATAVDSAGLPVPNLLVQFAVSDATLAVATSTGDATGTLTGLGKRGVAIVSAMTPLGISGSSRITFVPSAARIVVISGNAQTGVAGSLLAQPLVVEVQATDNLPVPGASVTFRAVTAGGSVQQATATADANGRASTTLTLGTIPGAYVYEAGSGALAPVSVSATATAAPAAAIAIVSGDAQTDTVGKTLPLPLVVKVTDQFGGAVSGATVTWTRIAGNGVLGATSTTTTAAGTTSIAYALGATASSDTIGASVAGVTAGVRFSATSVIRNPAGVSIVSGGNQSGLPNATLPQPLVARVADAQNNPIAGATVAWSGVGAGVSFNPVSSLTDALGQASTVATLGATSGTTTVTATVGTVTATTTLTTAGGNTLAIVAGDQQSAQAGAAVSVAPSVVLKDGLGTPIANAPVVFAVATGGGSITGATTTTNSSGVATVGSWTLGATPGSNTLTATSGSLTVTFNATGTALNHFSFVQPLPTQFVIGAAPVTIAVRVLDPTNDLVSQAGIVATLTGVASPGPNFPTLTATTDNSGTATFTVPTYNGPAGTVTITVSATGVTSVSSLPTPIVAPSASQLLITTQPSATVVNQAPFAQQPVLQLSDANGNPVNTAGVVVTATFASGPTTPTPVLSNATATTNASGQATFAGTSIAGPFGTYTLSFAAPGVTPIVSSAIVNGAGPANTLEIFGGNGQNAAAGTAVAVPPLAKVIDVQGNGVPGVVVTFTAVNSGSTVSNGTTTGTTVTVTTNAQGVAQLAAWTLSTTAGAHTMTASATVPNGSPVTFTANATVGGPSKFILVQPLPGQIVVGAPIPAIDVQIADANNNPVAQVVAVTLNLNVQPSGNNTNVTISTDARGIASFTLSPYVGPVGNAIVAISASGFTTLTSPAIPVVAGAPAALRFASAPSSSAQSGVPLAAQPSVQVVDPGFNSVATAGIPITATVSGATLSGTTTVNTNASGVAVFTNLALTGAAGPYTILFSSGTLNSVTSGTINLTAGGAASMSISAGNNQTVQAGGQVPILPAVLVRDAGGNPVAGVDVLFTAVTPGSFIDDVRSKTIQTDAQGIAAAQSFWSLSGTAGPNTLTASATGVTGSPLTFTATGTPGPASNMKLLQAVPASITVGQSFPTPLQLQLTDDNNNNVAQAGVAITATANVQPSNTTFVLNATTVSNGIATFNPPPYVGRIGTMIFTLTAPSIQPLVTSGINVLAGAPNKLVITTQPPATAASGVVFTPQPAVQVTDVGSNAVNATANVGAVIATGSGTLGGTVNIGTNGRGLATFGNLSLSGAPGSYTLRFQATGLTAAVSNAIDLGAGGPAAITIVAGDQQVVAAGTAVPVAPSVRVTDGAGTPLSGVGVSFTVTLGGGSTPPSGSLTNASGIATVSLWQLGTSVGTNNLTASVGALSTVITATAVAGPAAQIALVTPPPATAASGVALNPQPSVRLQDQFGNPVSTGGVQIAAAVLSGSGTLTNATATTNSAGLATFSGLTITGPAGQLTLEFTSGSLTHATSGTITLTGGAAAAITKSAGDNQSAAAGANVAIAPSVLVTDGAGNPVVGAQVTFTAATGGGGVTGTPATTNASGIATVGSWRLGNTIGANTLTATLGALTTTFNATSFAGPAARLTLVTAPPATAASGIALNPQPSVQVEDQFGNAVAGAGVAITASLLSGTGTLNNAIAMTNVTGIANFSGLTISGPAGQLTLQFNSPNVASAVSGTITLSGGTAAAITKQAGDGQTAIVATNVAVDPSVLVADGAGNPVAGVQVTFTVASGGGSVTGTPATTNASGIAQVSAWQLGNIAGPNSLTATLGALTTTFTATGVAAPPAALSFTTPPPTTSSSGVALSPQPIIQVRDQFGNATSASGTVTAVITSGTGTLNNATATIGSGGAATFSALTINGSGTFTLQFQSGSLTPISSSPITQAAGPAVNIAFSVAPTGGTGGVAFSPAVTVRLVDAQSNTVTSNNTNTVTLSIAPGTGTTGATLSGGGPVTFVNGVATFTVAAIDFGGTGYALRATSNLLNVQGAPMTATSSTFNIQPGPSALLITKPGTRVSVAPVGAPNLPSGTRPVFVARNAQGAPAPGLTVDLTALGRCRLLNGQGLPVTTLAYTSDANGEVTPNVGLPTFIGGSGCLIKATGATFTTAKDSSQIAVFPAQTSHVWTGAANSNWQNAANWIPVISVPSVPSSTSDNVFIPNYSPLSPFVVFPVVSGAKPAMNRLTLDSLAQVNLNSIGIDIGGGGVLGSGVTFSGAIHMTATAPVNGQFDVLDIGQAGCGTFAPFTVSLRDVITTVLNVRCRTRIDTTAVLADQVNVFPNAGQGWLQLTQPRATLAIPGNANFTGDSLVVSGGTISVGGTTTFGGEVNWSGGSFSSVGAAVFASQQAFYQTVQILLQGNATFGGTGAGRQQFAGGQLALLGNFSQIAGTVVRQEDQTFFTSSDHITLFAGSSPQTVSFATPGLSASNFSVLRLANQSAGGVQLANNAQIVNGTMSPRVDILQGRLQINSGATFNLQNGSMHLSASTNLNLIGNIFAVGQCTGKTTNGATITGGGLFNGTAPASFTCDDDR